MNRVLLIGLILCASILLISLIGPSFSFVNIDDTDLYRNHDGVISTAPYPPSAQNLLGTDTKGRDLLSLLILGARNTLLIILIIALVRYLIAIPLAILASRGISFVHNLLHGWNQIFSGLPTLIAVILIIHLPVFYNSPNRTIWFIFIIALIEVGRVGYLIQQNVSDLSKSTFVEAGRAVGNSTIGLYRRYFLPFLLPQLIVSFVLDLGRVLLLLGQLAFFSIFISQAWVLIDIGQWELQNTSIDWLSLIAESRHQIQKNPWLLLFPALAITITIMSLNFLGEGLRVYYENVARRKHAAIKWLTWDNTLSVLRWLNQYRRPILITILILVFSIGTFRFFYTGFYGSEQERLKHEAITQKYLATHYHPSAFTILETSYDFRSIPGYKTTFVYNIAPDISFSLTFIESDQEEISDLWRLQYEDTRGVMQEYVYQAPRPPAIPARPSAPIGRQFIPPMEQDIITYAVSLTDQRASQNRGDENGAIPVMAQQWEEDFILPVPNYMTLLGKKEIDNQFTSQYTGIVRLLDYLGVDIATINEPYKDSIYSTYISIIDLLASARVQGVQILPTYGDVDTIIKELEAGRPVMMMDRGNSMYPGGPSRRHSIMFIGYNDEQLLAFNISENKFVTYSKNELFNRGILPHPIISSTHNFNNLSNMSRKYYVLPQIYNSQMPEGLELYTVVHEGDIDELFSSSSLYIKLLGLDTFYKGQPNEQWVEWVESNEWIEKVDFEYVYYHLFIEQEPSKVTHLLPEMLKAYHPRAKEEMYINIIHPEAVDFILLQELQHRHEVLLGNFSKTEEMIASIASFIEIEASLHYHHARDTKRYMKLLHVETLLALGKYYLSQDHLSGAKDVLDILKDRGFEDIRVDELKELYDKKVG